MTTAVATRIALELDCRSDICRQFARPLFEQMASGRYDVCSTMPIPGSIDEWRAEHRTARRRADRCRHRGYRFYAIARHTFANDIFSINMSTDIRQGRPMSDGYRQRTDYPPLPDYQCARHAIRTYGVLNHQETLVAYLWLYRAGELALVSQILGHAAHLRQEVMWLLWEGMLRAELAADPDGTIVYNRHDSGEDGLRWWKEHVGLRETPVEWAP